MKYIRFLTPGGHKKYGILEGDTVRECEGTYFNGFKFSGVNWATADVNFLAPSEPTKIVAVGLNYKDHIREMKLTMPEEPVIFLKPSSAVLEPDGFIEIPQGVGQVDYEAELALVIKKTCKNIPKKDAKEYILGYTCLNDVTAREVQAADGQWARSKGYDTFAPFGPYIDDTISPGETDIKLILNGEVKQHSNTREFLFSVEELVAFASRAMTLYPGDVITTGTPSGIGPIREGDRVEVSLNDEMILCNKVRNGVVAK